ncbi:MAG: UDP-N-acetylmuramate--alanine ligase [Thermoleophilaceae bacterium]|jgi:UDP-N-acetylmuramate--alanine ligase|nr:UDP-N-acetylmuramate--alanine ligase [Thermoleophilaceae bacterium]
MDPSPWSGRRLHLIGIGGAGMSGLALVATALGAEVTGSDRAESPYMEPLRAAGIEPAIGHDAANVPDGADVAVSTAIADDNPELVAARAAGAAVLHRGDLLAEISRLKKCVAIAGTHGKTTTACMAAHALIGAGAAPSYVIGGELRTTGRNAEWSDGDWLVVEADESDRSFLKLTPEMAVVTNVELDHHSTYRSSLEIERAFQQFARSAGSAAAWQRAGLSEASLTYGIEEGDVAATDVRLEAGGSRFSALGTDVELRVPGEHNVLNALAALVACRVAGVEPAAAAAALTDFPGAKRRFERRGTTPTGAVVYDDYAHHPTEVRATLEAARTLGARRVIACFQPHLYSRTRLLARQFGRALALADAACVLDVYPARERAEDHPGVSGWLVAAATADASRGRPVYWTPAIDDAERRLTTLLREGDVLLTLGAGNVDELAGRLVGDGGR